MSELRAERESYVEARGLDPAVFLPGNMVAQDFLASNFRKIAAKDYYTLNHLRCLTYNFTGFQMLTMEPAEATDEVRQVPEDADARIRANAGKASGSVKAYLQAIDGMPIERLVPTPRMFGESGWDVEGRIVNPDTWSNQLRINVLHHSGILERLRRIARERGHVRVLEIGAGFGNLSYTLSKLVGPIDYAIVDLPDSMIYSSIFLNTVLPERPLRVPRSGDLLEPRTVGTTCIANHLFDEFRPQLGTFDLVVNTLSLSEMSAAQVDYYGACVRELLGDEGVFFEQNYTGTGDLTEIVGILGRHFAYGVELDETPSPHRARGIARTWANRYCGELWDRGGYRMLYPEPSCLLPRGQDRRETLRDQSRPAIAPGPELEPSC